ncbi:SusD/RagB family nutrient-binding outer membrane lipoprotein [Pedobacter sp. ASV1-7]|uniref:SusD/RagB family nutrient-binding outer membrane lipoprotein n=1 Tax=Pedobacter sp. ASV1-7 TaxID=3145237 RepID=UPI0032E8C423
MRSWTSPVTAQVAYETGITKSFEYWKVSLGSYLTSQDYNRVGTSVSWTHTPEPTSRVMKFEDGMTGTPGTVTLSYPKNDLLTKIITQKFIAQTPWQGIIIQLVMDKQLVL